MGFTILVRVHRCLHVLRIHPDFPTQATKKTQTFLILLSAAVSPHQ